MVLTLASLEHAELLGKGGEAAVYALDEERVVRLCHPGTSLADVEARAALLTMLHASASRLSFALPRVLDIQRLEGRVLTIEVRLSGRTLAARLVEPRYVGEAARARRAALIWDFLSGVEELGTLTLDLPYHGEIVGDTAVRAPSSSAYLEARARLSLAQAGPGFAHVDPVLLARALPTRDERRLLYLDAVAGNVLVDEDGKLSAVCDFGGLTACGDPQLDLLSAVAYLAPELTPQATDEDRVVGRAFLAQRGLSEHLEAATRWLAALWSFARDDAPLHAWCKAVLAA